MEQGRWLGVGPVATKAVSSEMSVRAQRRVTQSPDMADSCNAGACYEVLPDLTEPIELLKSTHVVDCEPYYTYSILGQ